MPTLEWRLYEAGFCTHPERATRRGAPLRACEFPALVPVLRHPEHGVILFDTGYSRHFFEATQGLPERIYRWVTPVHLAPGRSLAEQLEREGTAASDVAWVVISHLHGDHVGGLGDFPEAQLAVSEEAWQDLQGRGRLDALRKGLLPALVDAQAQARLQWFEALPLRALEGALAPLGPARDLFGDSSVLLVPLPGHAAGHFGLLFEDTHGPVFLVADASWSSQGIRDATPPPVLLTAWLGDTRAYLDTLAKLHALHLAMPALRIVPAHCREWRPAPAVAHA